MKPKAKSDIRGWQHLWGQKDVLNEAGENIESPLFILSAVWIGYR